MFTFGKMLYFGITPLVADGSHGPHTSAFLTARATVGIEDCSRTEIPTTQKIPDVYFAARCYKQALCGLVTQSFTAPISPSSMGIILRAMLNHSMPSQVNIHQPRMLREPFDCQCRLLCPLRPFFAIAVRATNRRSCLRHRPEIARSIDPSTG